MNDRIEKEIVLNAAKARVWKAVSDSQEFGQWFGVKLEGRFEPGAHVKGRILDWPTKAGLLFELFVDQMKPQQLFSFRWHPYAVEASVDYSKEALTLVTFELSDVPGGTKLVVVESGFDQVPLERRATAFARNSEGWAEQLKRIEKHVA